jgi:hypothetical protein
MVTLLVSALLIALGILVLATLVLAALVLAALLTRLLAGAALLVALGVVACLLLIAVAILVLVTHEVLLGSVGLVCGRSPLVDQRPTTRPVPPAPVKSGSWHPISIFRLVNDSRTESFNLEAWRAIDQSARADAIGRSVRRVIEPACLRPNIHY